MGESLDQEVYALLTVDQALTRAGSDALTGHPQIPLLGLVGVLSGIGSVLAGGVLAGAGLDVRLAPRCRATKRWSPSVRLPHMALQRLPVVMCRESGARVLCVVPQPNAEDAQSVVDVGSGIAVDEYQVGAESGRDPAPVGEAEAMGGGGGQGLPGLPKQQRTKSSMTGSASSAGAQATPIWLGLTPVTGR